MQLTETRRAARRDFEQGVVDLVLSEAYVPGFLDAFLTHPARGLDSYRSLIDTLETGQGVIKAFCIVSE